MKHCVCTSVLVWIFLWSGSAQAQPSRVFARQWQQVAALRKAASKGDASGWGPQLPAVSRIIEQIRRQALARNEPLEYLRAEQAAPANIDQLEAELPRLSFPARPLVHSLLGDAYVRYLNNKHYQQSLNAWKYRRSRNRMDDWTDGQVVSAAIQHYRASVMEAPARQLRVPLRTLPGVQLGGTPEARAAQPTLLDLLTHRAAEGFSQLPGLNCRLPDSLLEAAAHDGLMAFARRPLSSPTDSMAGICQSLWLWQHYSQALLAGPAGPAQRATAELERILLARPFAASARADSLALGALLRGARQYAALPVSADFLVAAARLVLSQRLLGAGQGDLAQDIARKRLALTYCREAERHFPRSIGGRQAAVLRQVLTGQPELSLTVPPTQLPQQAWQMKVRARQVPVVYVKAYRVPLRLSEMGASSQEFYSGLTPQLAEWLPSQKPVARWQQALTLCPDSACQSTQNVSCPPLPPGRYLLVAQSSPAASQSTPKPLVQYAEVEMSELVVLKRASFEGRAPDWRLLERRSGRVPLRVQWRPLYEAPAAPDMPRVLRWGPPLRVDSLGWLRELPARHLGTPDSAQLVGLLASQAGDSLLLRQRADEILPYPRNNSYASPDAPPAATAAVVTLATDRLEYRPGQTLRYQGLLTDASLATPGRPLANWADTLTITGANWQVLARQPVLSSADGTFVGKLTLPDTVLEATNLDVRMTRAVNTRWRASPWLRPAAGPPALVLSGPAPQLEPGQPVKLQGQVPGAARLGEPRPVYFRIQRQLLQASTAVTGEPSGWQGYELEIVRAGVVEAAADGTFAVDFVPEAPPALATGGASGYRYQVLVATMNAAGAYTGTVRLPSHLLALSGPSQLNQAAPAFFTLQAGSTLQGDQLAPVQGWLRLFRLQPPADTLAQLPPAALLQANWQRWPRTLAAAWPFDTRTGSAVPLPLLATKLPPGPYVLVAATTESMPAASQHSFVLTAGPAQRWLYPPAAASRAWTAPILPGDTLAVSLDSGAPAGPVLVEASIGDSLVASQWWPVQGGRSTPWQLPLARAWQGRQVKVLATQFHQNTLYSSQLDVPVLAMPAPLTLQLKRGGRLRVRDQAGYPVAAQVTAVTSSARLSGFEEEGSLLPLPWPKLPPSPHGPAAWELPEKFTYSAGSGSTWESELYWPMAQPPSLGGRRDLEMGHQLEDSVAVRQLHGLVPNAAAAASTVPRVVDELFRTVQSFPTQQLDSTYWQPALTTSARGRTHLRLPAHTDPGRRLLVRAHTRHGQVGEIDRWLAVAEPLNAQVRAWPLSTDGQQWLVTAGVRNDGLTVQQGRVRLVLSTARPKSMTSEPLTQTYRLLPGQQAVLSWHLTTPGPLPEVPTELNRRHLAPHNLKIICPAP